MEQTVIQSTVLPAVVMSEKVTTDTNLNIEKAKSMQIATQENYEQAGEFLKVLKGVQKEVINTFITAKENAVKTHKSIVAAEKKHLEPLEQAEAIVKDKMSLYFRKEQERIAAERKRLEDEERARRIAEQKRLAEEQKAREEQALKDAEALKAAGDAQAAEALINEVAQETQIEALPESIPVQVDEAPKMKGISNVMVWKYEIIDPAKVSRGFLAVDEQKIGRTVKAMGKDAEALIGGIKIYQDVQVRARS